MFIPTNTPPDPLGWRWYLPMAIIALIIASPLFFLKSDASWRQILASVVWVVVWSFIALGLRIYLARIYGE